VGGEGRTGSGRRTGTWKGELWRMLFKLNMTKLSLRRTGFTPEFIAAWLTKLRSGDKEERHAFFIPDDGSTKSQPFLPKGLVP
jgi:hypothetical protein